MASRLRTPIRHNFYYLSGRLAEPLSPLNALASISYSLFGHFVGEPTGRSVSVPNETAGRQYREEIVRAAANCTQSTS